MQLWNTYSMTMFPLTDDYEMADDVLTDMADKIDKGLAYGSSLNGDEDELERYLTPTFPKED